MAEVLFFVQFFSKIKNNVKVRRKSNLCMMY